MVICVMALYQEDVDAAWQRAVAAGAEVICPLEDVFAASAAAGGVAHSAGSG